MKNKFLYSVTPLWHRRLVDENGVAQVLITVNLNRQQFRLYVKLSSTEAEYKKAISGKGGCDTVKALRKSINEYVGRAEAILEKMPSPNKELFRRLFKSQTNAYLSNKIELDFLFHLKYEQLMVEQRFGSARNLKDARKSFSNFRNSILLEEVDEDFLKSYQLWMIDKGCSTTTAGIYLRALRAICKKAIKEGYVSEAAYPFKHFNIGSSVRSKSVLYLEELQKLYYYEPQGIRESRAIAFFFFCYLCNGINFNDLPYLRFKNISRNVLTFVRQKTKRTSRVVTEVKVFLCEDALQIITRWGNVSRNADDYIFPLMKQYKSAEHMHLTVVRYKRITNKSLKKIGYTLGLETKLTIGLARHSFGTRLNEEGVSIKTIADALGHKDVKTTEHYIKTLPDKNLKSLAEKLLPFKSRLDDQENHLLP